MGDSTAVYAEIHFSGVLHDAVEHTVEHDIEVETFVLECIGHTCHPARVQRTDKFGVGFVYDAVGASQQHEATVLIHFRVAVFIAYIAVEVLDDNLSRTQVRLCGRSFFTYLHDMVGTAGVDGSYRVCLFLIYVRFPVRSAFFPAIFVFGIRQ